MTGVKSLALGLGLLACTASIGRGSGISGSSLYFTDAYFNMSDGPYADAAMLTDGNARPWYLSPVVQQLYGGVPTAAQQADFRRDIAIRTLQTYRNSGVNLSLTDNPNDPVPHTLSIVSGTSNPQNPDAVGISTIGGNGFTFIDGLKYARSIDELKWAVAHNVAHELMHAFGGGHHDASGQYLDAAVTRWETLVDPNARFSPAAVDELRSLDFRNPYGAYATYYGGYFGSGLSLLAGHDGDCHCADCCDGAVRVTSLVAPVPEPTTLALWGGVIGLVSIRGVRRRRVA